MTQPARPHAASATDGRLVVRGARKVDADGEAGDFWFAAAGGVIVAVGTGDGWRAHATPGTSIVDAAGAYLTPGLVDIHSHGAGGHAFDDGPESIRTALAVHRAHGTTRSVLSLVTNPVDSLVASLETVARLAALDPLILGAHLEGPFLAESHKGAHNPSFLAEPTPEVLERLLAASGGRLCQLTIAPEVPGAIDAVDQLVEAGVTVAVGHTGGTEDDARRAFDHGARLVTHLFNAMPELGHRAPGPVAAGLNDERVTVELILDGTHVHAAAAQVAWTAAQGRVALITDAMAAAGAGDGSYLLGSLEVAVRDGLARTVLPDGSLGSIAGSTLTMDVAVRNAVELLGLPPVDAVAAATLVPARALGLDAQGSARGAAPIGRLAAGHVADAVLFDPTWHVREVWAAGRRLA